MPSRTLQWGEPAPWLYVRSLSNPKFCFDTVGGRYVALTFFGSAGDPAIQALLRGLPSLASLLDDDFACWFGVSNDPADETQQRLSDQTIGVRFFLDFDGQMRQAFGLGDGGGNAQRVTLVLDPRLRLYASIPWQGDPLAHLQQLADVLSAAPRFDAPSAAGVQAPILVTPRIFEPELCRTLIQYYEGRGGRESGFMRDVEGKTIEIMDYAHKRRRDEEIADEALRRTRMIRIHDRLVPEIRKAFQFQASRIERYIVACYEGEAAGHFRAHRDNTTNGTAHRRFAVSLNLNTGEYEGGQLRFPEFGRQLYTPPAGGAVVFSCSLLHEATPVTRGKRYVFLPFLYDEAAAVIRQQNQQFLG